MKLKIISLILALVLCLSSSAVVFAADNYSIISPQPSTSAGIVYCDNLLVSVKVSPNTSLRFTVYNYPNGAAVSALSTLQSAATSVKTQVGTSDSFKSGNKISFYTKQINKVRQGLYSLKVDTLDKSGKTVASYNKYFIVRDPASKGTNTVFESQPSDKVVFFQGVFKNIFGTAVVE